MNDTDVLIIGGGISGLATAWWLAQAGVSVQVWEADNRMGGKISSHQQDGYLTEQAASLLMNSRPDVAQLMNKIGLNDVKTPRLAQAKARRYLLQRGKLQALPMQLSGLLTSPLWSLRGKLRLLLEPFVLAGGTEDETVSQFIRRRLGNEMLEKAMEPYISGTLAANPDLASATATLPRLTALERRFGSITAGILAHKLLRRRTACSTDTFSFRGGMNTLTSTLARGLARTPGVHILSNRGVKEITPIKGGWSVTAATPDAEYNLRTTHVVVATPAPAAARLVAPLDTVLASQLAQIQYAPLVVLHLGLNRQQIAHPLDGTGFLTPRDERQPFTGNLWMSSLFANRAPNKHVLLTTYLGGARQPEATNWNDTRLVDETLHALTPLLALKGNPEMVRIDRHRQALPLYHGAHIARDRAITQQLQGLAGFHIEANYRGGISVRDRIARGQQLAQKICSQLRLTKDKLAISLIPSLSPKY
ncbi:MAG: protoporphyrinogen oxidase [Gammaproteobacteria bacterium]|nr:protoporphyrinogen oxidase [Gammaproteobacteria bacterium]